MQIITIKLLVPTIKTLKYFSTIKLLNRFQIVIRHICDNYKVNNNFAEVEDKQNKTLHNIHNYTCIHLNLLPILFD